MQYKIIHTDNFGGDYPDEQFVTGLPPMTREHAEAICEAINEPLSVMHPRYWKAVPEDYVLQPGFEP